MNQDRNLFDEFIDKAGLKQEVYQQGIEGLKIFEKAGDQWVKEFKKHKDRRVQDIPVQLSKIGQFEVRIRFAGDVAVFLMHSNVFVFPGNHAIYKVPYIAEEKSRAYFSVISIYNFLNDSFKYNRLNDVGHLIARIFINKDRHYFVESKFLSLQTFPLISQTVLDDQNAFETIRSVVKYIVDFDLHVPSLPYVENILVNNVVEQAKQLPTSKRLGFKFNNELEK
jgi:hypothetical protein